jgi:hypothetical protein
MGSKFPKILVLALGFLPAALWSADPVAGLLPEGLGPNHFEMDLVQRSAELPLWFGDDSGFSNTNRQELYYSEKLTRFSLSGRWQASPRHSFEFLVPYDFVEYSPYSDRISPLNRDDPTANFGDAWGDVQLRYRFLAKTAGMSRWGLLAALSVPSGRGPFQTSPTLLATGEGTWGFQGGLMASQSLGRFQFWQDALAFLPLGYQGRVPLAAALAPGPDGTTASYFPAGPAWVDPGRVYQGIVGCYLDFYHGGDSRFQAGAELEGSLREALRLGGTEIAGSEEKSLACIPQSKIEFASHFELAGGLRLPILLVHQMGPKLGNTADVFLRAGYLF